MKSPAKVSKQPTLQTVDRALSFLEFVASAAEPPTIQTVAEALGLNVTTSYHLLRTLIARGYIERHPDLSLTLGDQVGVLFRAYQQRFDIDESLKALVATLAEQTSETAYLSLLDGNRVILKVLAEGSQPLRVSGLFVGQSGNEHLRSSGKAVLAHLDPAGRAEMLSKILEPLASADGSQLVQQLEGELEQIRSRGWSLDEQGSDIGISSIGGPVFEAGGRVYGAIGIVTPTTRMHRHEERYVACVTKAADDATELLKHVPSA